MNLSNKKGPQVTMLAKSRADMHFFSFEWTVETMWADVVDADKGLYKLASIPFYGPLVASDDIIFAEYDEDEQRLTYRVTIENSGNSIGTIVIKDKTYEINNIRDIFKDMGCLSEHVNNAYFSKQVLELMDDKKSILIEQIKTVIIEMVHYSDELPKTKFSNYLSKKLNHDYTYLSNIFSEVKGVNISHFILMHKIERAKELIVYNDKLTLSEIAWKLHYSSAAHLSNQFKKITGLTPTHFKYMKRKRLIALDSL